MLYSEARSPKFARTPGYRLHHKFTVSDNLPFLLLYEDALDIHQFPTRCHVLQPHITPSAFCHHKTGSVYRFNSLPVTLRKDTDW
jgi:hypothetical protein